MEPTKFDERIENAVNGLFEFPEEMYAVKLSLINNHTSVTNETSEVPNVDLSSFITILKQVFLFLPGSFLLYGTTIVLSWNYFRYQPDNLFCLVVAVVSSLMIILGIGDIRNPKHLLIPLSVVSISAALFLISAIIGSQNFMQDASYYLFPLVFTLPFFVTQLIGNNR